MAPIRVGFIGTGRKKPKPDLNGFFMAYRHAPGYAALEDCELVACADLVSGNAQAFAREFGIPKVYTDFKKMLAEEQLDLVSICTWPEDHCHIVLDCITAGLPAIHCEKPMALTFGECRRMLAAARSQGTRLTFNHQRRFGKPFRKTRELLEKGTVGELVRLECACSELYDGGCHWVDLLNYFNGETPAEWVIGQIDCRVVRYAFGAPSEHQGVYNIKYRNGVTGIITTGPEVREFGPPFRVLGSDGIIEIGWGPAEGPMLRYLQYQGGGWQTVDCEGETLHGPGYHERAVADVVDCYRSGRTSELCAENQMRSVEIVFAGYESSRRRARIDLPLDVDDSPIGSMIASGAVGPKQK